MIKVRAYNKLINDIEELRTKTFSFDNLQDTELIFDLWNLLKKNDKLDNKITKRWTEIGFQGRLKIFHLFSYILSYIIFYLLLNSDPSTDFRGMGMLSLLNLQ